ncbi:hypothetical protein F5877DRAFT_28115, partial [Lentinula edodes]
LPQILQVEKQTVTTSAIKMASTKRRKKEAKFLCPVPGCETTFTRHLRSHTKERPFICQWPGCNKGFARKHDCKRHQALHSNKAQFNVCRRCAEVISRLEVVNV